MDSRSCPRKSARSRSDRHRLFASLLRDGARFQAPGSDIVEAAGELEALGVIQVRRSGAVFCANPDDRDFPPDDPDCPGLIELRQGADECDGDYACPVCGRFAYPKRDAKEQIELLTVTLDQAGIERFVLERCGAAAAAAASFDRGVLVLPDTPQNRFICITDFCTMLEFLDPAWLARQPCAHVIVDPRSRVRLGPAAEIEQVELVDLICGAANLDHLLPQQPRSYVPTDRPASMPSAMDEPPIHGPVGTFIVSVASAEILVNDVVVEDDDGSFAHVSFVELWRQLSSDLEVRRRSSPLSAETIAGRIQERLPSARVSAGSVQKALNRLDKRIVRLLREAGFSINRGDVIKSGRYGFSLNKVAIAP
jgi:hypothetical protein